MLPEVVFRGVAIVATLAAVAGCGTPPPASQFPTADDALGRMKAQYACVNGLQSETKIDVVSKRGRVKGDALFFAVNPARVRVDVVSPFGATLYTLTSDGRNFKMLDLPEKQFLLGPASACNLARLTQVPLEGHALVSILRGEAPVLKHEASATSITWDSDEGRYQLEVRGSHDAVQRVALAVHDADLGKPWNQQRVRMMGVAVAQRGLDLWDVELGDYKPAKTAPAYEDPDGIDPPLPPSGPTCDAEAPRSLRMKVPHTADDVLLEVSELTWNPPLRGGTFDQPMPGGVRRVPVDCR